MAPQLTNNIALGVGAGRLQEAIEFHRRALGFTLVQTQPQWAELHSGPLHLFLVEKTLGTPTFELQVENQASAMDELIAQGCEEIRLESAPPTDRFVRTPYGHHFCITEGS